MNVYLTILLAVVCIVLGVIVTSLFYSLRGSKEGEQASPGSGELSAGEPGPESGSESRSEPGLIEVAHLWRDPQNPGLIVEVKGQRLHSATDLSAGQRQGLETALKELTSWMKPPTSIHTPDAPIDVQAPAVSPPAPPPGQKVEPAGEVQPAGEGQPAVAVQTPKVKRPSINPFQMVANALKAEVRTAELIGTKSIAAMVDEVLQEKLKGGPLESRGIRLQDSPEGGLVVMVGLEKYDGVDAVPDEEIRKVIREAVEEWKKRTSRDAAKGEKTGT